MKWIKRQSETDDNIETAMKPPLGLSPKMLWQEERMQELARAIYEYIMWGYYDKLTVGLWCEKLQTMLNKKY